MKLNSRMTALFLLGGMLLGSVAASGADDKNYGPGVTDAEIKLGQTIPYSGPVSA